MWIDNLLKQNPNLWNTSSSRHLMAVVLGYLQTHAFYQQQKKRLMPGKFGLLLLGETNTGKTYLSNFLLEAWRYQKGKNWCEWNAGAHGDLAALIQKNWMTSIHEANMLATEVLEGAINAIVPSENNCEFGLILTANAGYHYREILSEPLLSRLHVIHIESPIPEEILHLSKLPEKDRETLLKVHYEARPLASIRGLLNAIKLCESGLELPLVFEMVYGLLSEEIQKIPLKNIRMPSVFGCFLAMCGFNNVIVCERVGAPKLGVLKRQDEVIEIPPLPKSLNERDQQFQYDIVLLRALEYQTGSEEKAFQKLASHYKGSYSRMLPMKSDLLRSSGEVKSRESKNLDFLNSLKINLPTGHLKLSSNNTTLGERTLVQVPQVINQIDSKLLLNEDQKDFLSSLKVNLPTEHLKLSSSNMTLGKQISLPLPQTIVQNNEPFFFDEDSDEDFDLISIQNSLEKPDSLKELYSKKTISGGRSLPSKFHEIAKFDGKCLTPCIPLSYYEIDEKFGLPILENGGEFNLIELPKNFYPEFLPSNSKESIIVTLKPPVTFTERGIILITLPGYYPKSLNDGVEINWHQGKFYANAKNFSTNHFSKDQQFQYKLVTKNDLKPIVTYGPALPCETFRIDESKLSLWTRQCLTNFRTAEKIQDLPELLDSLSQSLSNDFTYLDRKNFEDRQALDKVYQKDNLEHCIAHWLLTKKIVCVESAIILYLLCRPILATHGIPVYLMSGLLLCNKIVTSEKHSFVLVQWSAETFMSYDATPRHGIQSISNSFCMPPNPLLNFYKNTLVSRLQSVLFKLYKFSLKAQRPIYQMNPPGMLHPVREYLGLPAFELSLFDQKWTPQTLLTTSFPYFKAGKNFYEHYSCIHFLAEVLLEKQFKLLVWTKLGAVAAANADIFIDLLMNRLQIPTSEELKKLKYPFPYHIMDETRWQDFFQNFSKILHELFTEEKYVAYSNAMERENQESQKIKKSRSEAHKKQIDKDREYNTHLRSVYKKKKPKSIESKSLYEQFKIEEKEYRDFIENFNEKSNGKITCSYLTPNFINDGEIILQIQDCYLSQADLDEILKFPCSLMVKRKNWAIIFVRCEFIGTLNFKNLPSVFKTIDIEKCINLSNIELLPCRDYEINYFFIINESKQEIDKLFNFSNFNYKLRTDYIGSCIKINKHSGLKEYIIEDEAPQYHNNIDSWQKIILEHSFRIKLRVKSDITYLLKLNEIKAVESFEKLMYEIYHDILYYACSERLKFQFVLDKVSPTLQDKLLSDITEFRKETGCILPLQLYCAEEAINCFIKAFKQNSLNYISNKQLSP